MRILCLTARLPYPPNRGDRLRAFHFIEHLSREHELSLVSFIAQESEREHLSSLKPYCQGIRVLLVSPLRSMMNGALGLWRREPLQTLYYHSNAMRRLVDQVLAETSFDAAYVHLFRMAPYVAHHPELYRIVDLTDVISEETDRSLPYRGLVSRLLYRAEKSRIVRYERWIAETFEETWLISDADRRALAAACPKANIQVVTNGVDEERLHPTGQPCEPNSLIFVGHLRVFHNVDAAIHLARDILPLVRKQIPDCTLKIVGADPDAQVRQLVDDPAVTVTGFVPDLNAALNQAAVFVAPLRFAAGVQNKVLEAMATGRPVVTTSVVNAGSMRSSCFSTVLTWSAISHAGSMSKSARHIGLQTQVAGICAVGLTFASIASEFSGSVQNPPFLDSFSTQFAGHFCSKLFTTCGTLDTFYQSKTANFGLKTSVLLSFLAFQGLKLASDGSHWMSEVSGGVSNV